MLYVLIILLLASFVFTFLGARTWHWGYVILVEAIFLASVGAFLLAAETLRINAALRSQVKSAEFQVHGTKYEELQGVKPKSGSPVVVGLEEQIDALKNGTTDSKIVDALRNANGDATPLKVAEDATSVASPNDLDHELLIATRRRGRVWRNVTPAGVDPKTGNVKVTITAPTPAGLKADTVLFVFEEGPPQPLDAKGAPHGPQYIGEFNVSQAAGQQVTLVPTIPLLPNDFEARRLAASKGPWIMYETMPTDRYEFYADLKEDQLNQLLPKQSVKEYLRHGKEATADDSPWRKVGFDENGVQLPADQIGKATKVLYERRLRDYAAEIEELSRRHIAMLAEADAVHKDIDELTAAEDVAKKLQAFRTEERQKLTTDLAGVTKERETIEKHLAAVEQLLAKARQLTADTIAHNRQLVGELTARQLPAQRPKNNGTSSPAKQPEPLALSRSN